MIDPETVALSAGGKRGWRHRYYSAFSRSFWAASATSYLYLVSTTNTSLHNEMDEADRTDPGWHIMEIEASRRSVEADKNIGDVVLQVKALLPANWPVWYYTGSAKGTGFTDKELRELERAFSNLEPQCQLNPKQLKVLRAEVKRAEPAIKEALKVLQMSYGRFSIKYGRGINIIGTQLRGTQETRQLANVLNEEARLRAQDGDADGALTACRAILLGGRAVGDEPLFISTLVRIAIRAVALASVERTLGQGQPSATVLAELQTVIEEELGENLLLIGARGERAVCDEVMEDFQNSPLSVNQKLNMLRGMGGPSASIMNIEGLGLLVPGSIKSNRAAMLHFSNRFVAIARMLVEEQPGPLRELEEFAKQMPPIARLLGSAVMKVANAYHRNVAQMRCCLIMLAAERLPPGPGTLARGHRGPGSQVSAGRSARPLRRRSTASCAAQGRPCHLLRRGQSPGRRRPDTR